MVLDPFTRRLDRSIFLVRLCIGGASIGFVALLFLWHLQPGGTMTLRYVVSPKDPPALLQNFASKEKNRLIGQNQKSGDQKYFQAVTVDPLYFRIPAIRKWETAKVSLVYDNPDQQPFLRLGLQQKDSQYRFYPLAAHDDRLETLLPYWVRIQDGDVVLWQKNSKAYSAYEEERRRLENYNSQGITDAPTIDTADVMKKFNFSPFLDQALRYPTVSDFLANPPTPRDIVTFAYDLSTIERIDDYTPARQRTTVTTSLRGSHTIVAYVGKTEDLDFDFFFRDINRHTDNDAVAVTVTRGSKEIAHEIVQDDGIHDASNRVVGERRFHLVVPKPGEGVYRIQLRTTDDAFLTRFSAQQHLFFFEGALYLTDSQEYRDVLPGKTFSPTTFFTDATTLSASTSHVSGLQALQVGDRKFSVEKIHEEKIIKHLSAITRIQSPQNDLRLSGGGFAFSQEGLFLSRLNSPQDLESLSRPLDSYDYIIARPMGRKRSDGLNLASATVPSGQLSIVGGNYEFIISAPGLSEGSRSLHIYELTVTFRRSPLTLRNLFPRLSKFFRQTFSSLRS